MHHILFLEAESSPECHSTCSCFLKTSGWISQPPSDLMWESILVASFMGEEEALTWDPSILKLVNGQVRAITQVS